MSFSREPFIDIIAGTRPNFVKIAPIIHALEKYGPSKSIGNYRLVSTGQHYDKALCGCFFEQLDIPQPDENLMAGSGTQAEQTASIMTAYEELLFNEKPTASIVVGDVNSTLACTLAARKMHVPVAHVEAGIRSGDWGMPEEINRVVTDSISNYFFVTTKQAAKNLNKSGANSDHIHFVGNTMIDTLRTNESRFSPPVEWDEFNLNAKNYLVVTLHRPSNVDDFYELSKLLETICSACAGYKVIFPVHPRTLRQLAEIEALPANLVLINPQPYLQFNYLVKHALAVLTDSGGITEEATAMSVPCLTLRDTTERPETVELGTNALVGKCEEKLTQSLKKIFKGKWKQGQLPEKWDGKSSERIVALLHDIL